ncbi:hypothetical protein FEZ32_08870 [Acidipropionibacterium jensenii]|uniref:hypothetical protein n=1 Tax=Acidipropionibacterium jensenii TaxID=1749 RepID=UPI00110AEA1D|nr:hypothetical protein [Acidipropionibacterium jensenii]QCV88455.1 hypothetical protein FEZ32_08870 [Acidipropionibacterium jensenii]
MEGQPEEHTGDLLIGGRSGYIVGSRVQISPHLEGPAIAEMESYPEDPRFKAVLSMHAMTGKGYQLRELTFSAREGEPELTSAALREFPVRERVREAAIQVIAGMVSSKFGNFTETIKHIQDQVKEAGGRLRPTAEVLELVAIAHEFCQVLQIPTIKNIQAMFSIPNRTASHWVRLSKDRGHLQDDPINVAPDPTAKVWTTRLSAEEVDRLIGGASPKDGD